MNIRGSYAQLYDNKLDNLEEMNLFLQTQNLPRLNYEETESPNIWITSKRLNQ